MKIRIFLAAMLTAFSMTACGFMDEPYEKDKESKESGKNSSSVSDVKETKPEKETVDPDEFDDYDENEHDFNDMPDDDELLTEDEEEFQTGYVSEKRSMQITQLKRNLKSDDDGFKIKNGILYDYDGVRSEVHIPDGVKRIESTAFWSNSVVEAVFIPSSVEEIGAGAFWSCSGLKFVQAEEGLKGIASSAFWSCSGLEHVNLPASLERTGDAFFWAIDELTIHAPSGSYAQKAAESNGIAFSPEYAEFEKADRKNLIRASQYEYGDFTEFTIDDNIKGIDADAFQYCRKLETITIPSNVEYIASRAFGYCESLKSVNIEGCKEIKADAFEYCEALETVRIGEGTEKIGDGAFAYCNNMKDIYLPESVNNIHKYAFSTSEEAKFTLHVPAGSYAEDYALAYNLPFDNNIG